jgi:hypothetical protein
MSELFSEEPAVIRRTMMWPILMETALNAYSEEIGVKANVVLLTLVKEGLEAQGYEIDESIFDNHRLYFD